jgi:choline dehydrogenase-like flavoprotein
MFIDARKLPEPTTVEADLAIVGGGPAGITLACALAGSRISVCLIEAGGLEPDAQTQTLYEGENAGIEYPLSGSRLRYFGGSSNHWGGYCRPLDPIDFEARDWVPFSGWPFGIDELVPYYPPASARVEVAPAHFDDLAYWQEKTGEHLLELASGRMQTRFVHFSPPTHFGERYRAELTQGGNVRVLLYANVVNIASTEAGRTVTHLDVRTLSGLSHTVKARSYVLATGGLENARLLLLSNKVVAAGLGNQHDLVGRFFMEHPHLTRFGEIVVADIQRLPRIYRERLAPAGSVVNAAFDPSPEFLRERRLLNATFMMAVAGEYGPGARPSDDPQRGAAHTDMLRAASRFLSDGDNADKSPEPGAGAVWLGIGCACEQVPNPASRVSLSTERDALEQPKIRLNWRLTAQDRHSVIEHMRSLALEFGALDIGRMMLKVEDDGRWPELVVGGNHHMGTTRMSDDPRRGVVDRNARVHGTDNLYVAGSSVFPTSGAANPTLTIVAMTLRLADHLRKTLQ